MFMLDAAAPDFGPPSDGDEAGIAEMQAAFRVQSRAAADRGPSLAERRPRFGAIVPMTLANCERISAAPG